jgi:hypothetical protein
MWPGRNAYAKSLKHGWGAIRRPSSYGRMAACTNLDANARVIRPSLPSWWSISPPGMLRISLSALRREKRTRTLSLWGGSGARAVARLGRRRLPPNSGKISPAEPPLLDGARTPMVDDQPGSNTYIETELTRQLVGLEKQLNADVISLIVPIHGPVDDLIRGAIEDIQNKAESLVVILETTGGSIETAERIANVFRHHYPKSVKFLIPNFAMSAGTILVMSGDDIFMDYYSVLGPIDPQVENHNGAWVPALGYLEKYRQFIAKSAKGNLTAAEIAFLIDKFDPAELHRFEQARDHSVDLLKEWLVKYKFKNWVKTRTRKIPVTQKMREKRAEEIAKKLHDTKKWRSHGRGLSMAVVGSELNLLVEDFGANAPLNKGVRDYYRLMQDYMMRRDQQILIHTREKYLAV